jgi:hypothetical protein
LGLLRGNLDITQPSSALAPLAAGIAVSLLLWIAVTRIVRDRLGSALAVSVVVLGALSYGSIALTAEMVGIPVLTPFATVLLLLIAFRMLRLGPRVAAFTSFANTGLTITLVFLIVPIAWSEWRRPVLSGADPLLVPSREKLQSAGSQPRHPDVYVLVLDGYGRDDVLRSLDVQNGLARSLRAAGFHVAEDARANYPQTVHSLASALNMRYLPELIGSNEPSGLTRRSLGDLIRTNAFMQAFASAGYRIRFYRSEYDLVRAGGATELRSPTIAINEFDLGLYESTVLPVLSRAAGFARGALPLAAHRFHVRWTFDDLLRSVGERGASPSLTFAHVLAPHPPFAFNADGSPRVTALPALLADGDHWRAMAHGSSEQYEQGYRAGVGYVTMRVQQLVDAILARSDRETIIYVQGDHGPGSRLRFDDPTASDLVERFGILLALRLPGGEPAPWHHSITPVNALRAVVNAALGASLPGLDDRSYFMTWTHPFEFVDVTPQLIRCAEPATDCASRD